MEDDNGSQGLEVDKDQQEVIREDGFFPIEHYNKTTTKLGRGSFGSVFM